MIFSLDNITQSEPVIRHSKNHLRDAAILLLLFLSVFSYFLQDGYWNSNSRFGLIFSFVETGHFYIDSYCNEPDTYTEDRSFYNGHYYSDKAIGPAILGIIFYYPLFWMRQLFYFPDPFTTREILTILVVGLPSALSGSLIYLFCLYLSRNRFRSFMVATSIELGTMIFPYSIVLFSHSFSAALLFTSFYLIFFLKEKPKKKGGGYFFLIGLLLGWAFISEYPTAIIIAFLCLYFIFVIRQNPQFHHWEAIVFPIIGFMIPLFLQISYNRFCFGSFVSMGYSHLENEYFQNSMNQGLAGIGLPDLRVLFYTTIHPLMGIFWQSPVLIFAFFGIKHYFSARPYRFEAILAAMMIIFYFIILSGYYMWWGGYSLGPRHLIPILPFFSLFVLFVPERLKIPWTIISIISFGQMLIAAASNMLVPDDKVATIASSGFFEYSNIYNYCLQQLLSGRFNPNLGSIWFNLDSWKSLIPLFMILTGCMVLFFRNEKKGSRLYNIE